MCGRRNKTPAPLWGILISGMRPCGWHGTTKVVIPFHPSTIFHPAPFVFHLEKQNCSPFSSCKNMASQKALREVSITGMDVLWLPQHTVSDLLSKKKTPDTRVMAPEITRNVAQLKLKSLSVTGWRAYISVRLQYIRHSKYTVVERWARVTQRTMSADTVPLNETWAFLSEETHSGNTVSVWSSQWECGRMKSSVWRRESYCSRGDNVSPRNLLFSLATRKRHLRLGETVKTIRRNIANTKARHYFRKLF